MVKRTEAQPSHTIDWGMMKLTKLAYKVEHSPLWFLGRLLIPNNIRRKMCEESGRHNPQIIDCGKSKMCPECGAW